MLAGIIRRHERYPRLVDEDVDPPGVFLSSWLKCREWDSRSSPGNSPKDGLQIIWTEAGF
jgi:hypothetical protein